MMQRSAQHDLDPKVRIAYQQQQAQQPQQRIITTQEHGDDCEKCCTPSPITKCCVTCDGNQNTAFGLQCASTTGFGAGAGGTFASFPAFPILAGLATLCCLCLSINSCYAVCNKCAGKPSEHGLLDQKLGKCCHKGNQDGPNNTITTQPGASAPLTTQPPHIGL